MKFYEALRLMQEEGKKCYYLDEKPIYYWGLSGLMEATLFYNKPDIKNHMLGEGWKVYEEPKKTKKVILWCPIVLDNNGTIWTFKGYSSKKEDFNIDGCKIVGWHSIEVEVEDV